MHKAFDVPNWLIKNGAIYQINPRTFSKEGTVDSVIRELPFLASMGFGTIYLCPIYSQDTSLENWSKRQVESGTGNPKNPYRIYDYYSIDPEYGTMEELKKFTNECHKLGLKVLFDLVYRHIGPSSQLIKEHPEFVKQDKDGNFITNVYNFPEFNFNSEALREYLYANMVYYISVIGADGFRCDSTDPIPDSFWEEGRRRIRTIKSDAILINEGTSFDNLGICFDVKYCFSWHIAIYDILQGVADASLLREKWEWYFSRTPENGVMLRSMDDHDTVTDWKERIEVIAGHDGLELILVLTYLIDGVPMVYCGNELADTKHLNMFANRFYKGIFEVTDRDDKKSEASVRRQQIIKKLNKLRKESVTLARGETKWIENEKRESLVVFKRVLKGEVYYVLGNMSRDKVSVSLPDISGEVIMESKVERNGDNFAFEPFGYTVVKGE